MYLATKTKIGSFEKPTQVWYEEGDLPKRFTIPNGSNERVITSEDERSKIKVVRVEL